MACADREISLLQRKMTPIGRSLDKITGWTHRLTLNRRGVRMINGMEYRAIDDEGLHLIVKNQPLLLKVDTKIARVGQEPLSDLFNEVTATS